MLSFAFSISQAGVLETNLVRARSGSRVSLFSRVVRN